MRHATSTPRRRRARYAVVLVGITLGLLACSGDSESDEATDATQSDPSPSTTSASAASGNAVRVLVVDNSESSSQPQPEVIASARAAEAGLADSPRPIAIVPCEVTASDPADTGPAMACVRQAIEEGVAAFVGTAPEDGSTLLEDAGIPQFAPNPLSDYELTSPNSFIATGGAQLLFAAQGVAAAEEGGSQVAVVGFDIEAAAPLIDMAKRAVEGSGGEVAAEILVPFQAVDVTPQVQQIADADADAVLIVTTEDVAANLIRTIDQFGLDVAISVPAGGLRQETLDSLGGLSEGLLSGGLFPKVNVDDENAPMLDQYIEDMEATDSFDADLTRDTGIATWIDLYAISLAAERVDGAVDGPALLAALQDPEPLTLPIVGDWDPTATGPLPDAPRISIGTGYLLRYEGDGAWATLPPEDGVDLFDVLGAG
jgi:ABC-type branched-subunit amino acid transport system substrate-binding protein